MFFFFFFLPNIKRTHTPIFSRVVPIFLGKEKVEPTTSPPLHVAVPRLLAAMCRDVLAGLLACAALSCRSPLAALLDWLGSNNNPWGRGNQKANMPLSDGTPNPAGVQVFRSYGAQICSNWQVVLDCLFRWWRSSYRIKGKRLGFVP